MAVHDIALVGCGGVSAMHLDAYPEHPDRVRLVAACDPLPERRAWVREMYGVADTFESVAELLGHPGWEVAVVCTPTSVRRETVAELAAAGKHVLVEKPMSDTVAEAEALVASCADAGVLLAVDQNFRDHYPFAAARELVEEGRIGDVTGVVHHDLFFRQDRGWRTTAERHALSVMGVHWLDGFRILLGRDADRVWCRTASAPAVDCAGETEAYVQLQFGSTPVSYVQSFSSRLRRTETIVLGQEGTIRMDYAGLDLHTADGETQHRDNAYARGRKPESAFRSLDRLLTALEDGGTPSNSGADNLKTVTLLDAAYESARTGKAVTLVEGRYP